MGPRGADQGPGLRCRHSAARHGRGKKTLRKHGWARAAHNLESSRGKDRQGGHPLPPLSTPTPAPIDTKAAETASTQASGQKQPVLLRIGMSPIAPTGGGHTPYRRARPFPPFRPHRSSAREGCCTCSIAAAYVTVIGVVLHRRWIWSFGYRLRRTLRGAMDHARVADATVAVAWPRRHEDQALELRTPALSPPSTLPSPAPQTAQWMVLPFARRTFSATRATEVAENKL